jgi:hypothetical protein
MDERIRVAQNVDVYPPESRIIRPARCFHSGGQQVDVREEPHPFRSGHLCQRCRGGVFAQEDAVTGQKLHIADDRVSTPQFFQHGRILSARG